MALIAYLKSDAVKKPTTISTAPKEAKPTCGLVTSNIQHGELFIFPKGREKERMRLRWQPKGDRGRELPAGTYSVMGYRHVAKAADGAPWIWSTTSPVYADLVVKAGETVHFEVRSRIALQARAFAKGAKHRVALVFKVEPRLGTTLYRSGRRIDITWQCLDDKMKVLAKGAMRYG